MNSVIRVHACLQYKGIKDLFCCSSKQLLVTTIFFLIEVVFALLAAYVSLISSFFCLYQLSFFNNICLYDSSLLSANI